MDIVQQLVQRYGAQGSVGRRLVRSRSSGFRRLALGQLLLHLFGQILHKGAGQRIVRHLARLSGGKSRLLRGRYRGGVLLGCGPDRLTLLRGVCMLLLRRTVTGTGRLGLA